jgi:hypothetical protein
MTKRLEVFALHSTSSMGFRPIIFVIHDAWKKRPNTETRAWQLITSVSEAQARLDTRESNIGVLETAVSSKFRTVIEVRDAIVAAVESICQNLAELDKVKIKLGRWKEEGFRDISKISEVENFYSSATTTVYRRLEGQQRGLNTLGWGMALLGMKVARQTVILEYFKPLNA